VTAPVPAAARRNVGLLMGAVTRIANRVGVVVLMAAIRTYQYVLSPWVTQQCKYYPSCSAYGLEAVRLHGAVRGSRLAVWRILRCNPWSEGGVDYVPAPLATEVPACPVDDLARSVAPDPMDLARI